MIQREKPKSFSDFYNDNTQESLNKILAKDEDEYDWGDFTTILGPILPAGLYNETIYALPILLEYFKKNPEEQFDCMSILTGYIGKRHNLYFW